MARLKLAWKMLWYNFLTLLFALPCPVALAVGQNAADNRTIVFWCIVVFWFFFLGSMYLAGRFISRIPMKELFPD